MFLLIFCNLCHGFTPKTHTILFSEKCRCCLKKKEAPARNALLFDHSEELPFIPDNSATISLQDRLPTTIPSFSPSVISIPSVSY